MSVYQIVIQIERTTNALSAKAANSRYAATRADGHLYMSFGGMSATWGVLGGRVSQMSVKCNSMAGDLAYTIAVFSSRVHPQLSVHRNGIGAIGAGLVC